MQAPAACLARRPVARPPVVSEAGRHQCVVCPSAVRCEWTVGSYRFSASQRLRALGVFWFGLVWFYNEQGVLMADPLRR